MKKITKELIAQFYRMLSPCRLCPRECGVDRLNGETGNCNAGLKPKVSSYHQHFGEEYCLVGRFGSGTIFFTHCNLHCVYCQNYDISQHGIGREITAERLAEMMIELQELGCHNINLVTPTPWVPQIVEALGIAQENNLTVPVVYNCGGYESVEILRMLEGIIDIYMPDVKYGDNEKGKKYSGVHDYWDVVKKALKEMHRQVGDLVIEDGIARKGLLIRHLVLPNGLSDTKNCLEFIANEISKDSFVNVMDQYYPAYNASRYPELNRRITPREYMSALENYPFTRNPNIFQWIILK
ncbi:MAG: radical SAM protein [candidate division WOR-3 bacterium]|nr:radical SAM protein [candidate division WOR-3 bacterium]